MTASAATASSVLRSRGRRFSADTSLRAVLSARITERRGFSLPVGRAVVLQELPPHVLTGVEAVDDRIDDARCAVDDVERRAEAVLGGLALRDVHRVLIGHPTGV